ncbi:MAG: hypothetical protein HQM14_15380 [SAR324 cluster bacterium]|nr:hypothetical protein [SAR324 cluster bacterium]
MSSVFEPQHSFLRLPKLFQCEKELLHRRNIVALPETETAEGQGVLSHVLIGKLPVSLMDIRKKIEQGEECSTMIDSHLRHYLKKNDKNLYRQHLLSLAHLCIKQARAENHKEKQIPLLFKAIDMLRTYIQYCDEGIDLMASSVILHVMSTFPREFDEKLFIEKEVYKSYVELHKLKRRVSDIGYGDKENVALRIKLSKLCAQEKNYYDAFVHFGTILQIYKFRGADDPQAVLNRARTHAWIGNVFQELIHYVQPGRATILINFIDRYNRDHGTRRKPYPIAVLRRNDAIAMRKTKRDIIRLANAEHKAIEKIAEKVGSVGYQATEGVIVGLGLEKFKPHLIKALKEMKGTVFQTREDFFKKMKQITDPPPNEVQQDKIWVYISSDAQNIQQGALGRLRRNNKWLDVYFESMFQMAKNYEYLDMGDDALKYAKLAYTILIPIRDRRYLEHKQDILNYAKDLCSTSNLTFRRNSKNELRDESVNLRTELSKLGKTIDREVRDRHIAHARVMAR